MRIKIVNGEHGIGACNSEDVPGWVMAHGSAKDVAFFYCHERDFIVLNEDNVNYDFYLMIIQNYLEFSNRSRRELKEFVADTNIRAYRALQCLDYIIRVRRNLYKSMARKSVNN